MTCNCESSYCDHGFTPCIRLAGRISMIEVGKICNQCYQSMTSRDLGDDAAPFEWFSLDCTPIAASPLV